MLCHRLRFLFLALLAPVGSVLAHHSYAVFDARRARTQPEATFFFTSGGRAAATFPTSLGS
jgi:hypothetical protein